MQIYLELIYETSLWRGETHEIKKRNRFELLLLLPTVISWSASDNRFNYTTVLIIDPHCSESEVEFAINLPLQIWFPLVFHVATEKGRLTSVGIWLRPGGRFDRHSMQNMPRAYICQYHCCDTNNFRHFGTSFCFSLSSRCGRLATEFNAVLRPRDWHI